MIREPIWPQSGSLILTSFSSIYALTDSLILKMADNNLQSIGLSEVTERSTDSKSMTISQRTAMSAALVVDAKDGQLVLCQSSDCIDVKLYFLYRHWIFQYLIYLTIIFHHFMILFEKSYSNEIWIICLEIMCLSIYLIRLSHLLLFTEWSVLRNDKKNVIVLAIILVTIFEIFISLVFNDYIRWTPVLRPLFIVNFSDNKQVILKKMLGHFFSPTIKNYIIWFNFWLHRSEDLSETYETLYRMSSMFWYCFLYRFSCFQSLVWNYLRSSRY